MRLFPRRRQQATREPSRAEVKAETTAHFRQFVSTRVGVEGYLEPATYVDPPTLVLVARTGEWTRRRVPDAQAARELGRTLEIPVYDVNLTGYPARMREWSAQQRRGG
ncbi:oxidoreductase [Georgenia faecalis]|uniref:Oxidoreductase n=1 Tax=Georgenia faecalis TaxID=2483799 RepID=A0ABV9DC36_9MICO|nr:oxidoreductase [Georgenia faecalis]